MIDEPVTPDVLESAPEAGRLAGLAAKLGCTEGQLYSMVIAFSAASVLVLGGGVPLGDPPRAEAAPQTTPPPVVVAPAPSVTPAPPPLVPLVPGPAVPVPIGGGPATLGPVVPGPAGGAPQPQDLDLRVPAPGLPRALVADAQYVYAGTDNGGGASRVFAFSRAGTPPRVFTISGQPPERSGGLSAAALHGSTLVLTDRSSGVLLELDPRTGTQRRLATLTDLPPCLVGIAGSCQPGAEDLPATPEGVAVVGENAYVADAGQGTIWRYSFTTKQLTAWYTSSDFVSSGPSGLAVNAQGDLVFTVAESADPAALLRGALYRLDVAADGTAGTRTLLATFEPEAGAGPVAVGRSAVYVGLSGLGGVVAVKTDGTVTAIANAAQVPAPGGLSLVEGTLYVADAGKPATASSGVVHAVRVLDGPA